jgi:hypothetical protein
MTYEFLRISGHASRVDNQVFEEPNDRRDSYACRAADDVDRRVHLCKASDSATCVRPADVFIWRLTPTAPDDPSWQASSHRGAVVVRAPDEERAREEAQKAFGVQTRFPPGTAFSLAPWTRSALVRAEILEQSRHDPDGPIAVLEPSFDTDLGAQPPPR